MLTVELQKAKVHLSRLITKIARGEEVVIAKRGKPVARLVPFGPTGQERRFGKDAGAFEVPEDFDARLPPEVLAGFSECIPPARRPVVPFCCAQPCAGVAVRAKYGVPPRNRGNDV